VEKVENRGDERKEKLFTVFLAPTRAEKGGIFNREERDVISTFQAIVLNERVPSV
jgi:hypothetical protein